MNSENGIPESYITNPDEARVRAEAEDKVRKSTPLGRDVIQGTVKPRNPDVAWPGKESAQKHWKNKANEAAQQAAVEAGYAEKPTEVKDFSLELTRPDANIDPDVASVYYESKRVARKKDIAAPDGQAIVENTYNGDGIDKFHGRNNTV